MRSLEFISRSWWKSEWDVLRDDTKVGEFAMTDRWSYGNARAKVDQHEYIFSMSNWMQTGLAVTDASGNSVATVTSPSWLSSRVVIETAGTRYTLRPANWWSSRYIVENEDERPVLEMQMRYWKKAAEVHVEDQRISANTLYLLTFLTFYSAKIVEAQGAMIAVAGGAVAASAGS